MTMQDASRVDPKRGVDPKNAAEIIGCSTSMLYRWRKIGIGPKFYPVGLRLIRYRQSDLDEWIAANLRGDSNV